MSSKANRRVKNFIMNPKMQLRITLYFMVLGLAILGAMLAMIHGQIQEVQVLLATTSGVSVTLQQQVQSTLTDILKISALFFLISLIGAFVYGVIISHRIAGPMFAATQLIKDLKNGNYRARRQIRPYDELAPVVEGLNELAETLEKKHPSA